MGDSRVGDIAVPLSTEKPMVCSQPVDARLRVSLLGTFELTCDEEVIAVPVSGQRLLALLALADRQLPRAVVAGRLWGDTTEHLSQSCLRSALWRLHRGGHHLVEAPSGLLQLAETVMTDTREVTTLARALIDDPEGADLNVDPSTLTGDLLPGWDEDWVVIERERLRQLCLHGLESLAQALLRRACHARAIDVAFAAIRYEPLRESAHRVLIQTHIDEGNRSEALLQYHRFAELLRIELGIEPSPTLRDLVGFK